MSHKNGFCEEQRRVNFFDGETRGFYRQRPFLASNSIKHLDIKNRAFYVKIRFYYNCYGFRKQQHYV